VGDYEFIYALLTEKQLNTISKKAIAPWIPVFEDENVVHEDSNDIDIDIEN